jgi:hypothetical protein
METVGIMGWMDLVVGEKGRKGDERNMEIFPSRTSVLCAVDRPAQPS